MEAERSKIADLEATRDASIKLVEELRVQTRKLQAETQGKKIEQAEKLQQLIDLTQKKNECKTKETQLCE